MTKRFQQLCKRSNHWRETNDCTVKALAIVTGWTYERAHGELALRGRNHGKGTSMSNIWAALNQNGFTAERLPDHHPMMKENIKTIGALTREGVIPSRGVFIVETSRHVLGIRAGQVHDWTDGRRHRIGTTSECENYVWSKKKDIYRVKRKA